MLQLDNLTAIKSETAPSFNTYALLYLNKAFLSVIKVLLIFGQTDGVNMVGQFKWCINQDKSNVVVHILGRKLRMHDDHSHIPVLMIQRLTLSLSIPLSTPRIEMRFN